MSIEVERPQPVNLSKDQINQLREGFNAIDKDKSGYLDSSELGKFLIQAQIQPQFASLAIKLVDSDHDNRISFEEFLTFIEMLNELRNDPNAIYIRLFNVMDKNKNGSLESTEIKDFLSFFSKSKVTDQQVQQFIAQSDANGDGRLTFDELKRILGL